MFVSFGCMSVLYKRTSKSSSMPLTGHGAKVCWNLCLRCYQVISVSVPTLSKLTILRCSSIRSTGKRLSLGSTRSYKPQPSMLCLAILMKSNLRWKSWKPMARCKRRCPCSSLVVVLVHVVGDSLQVDQIFNCPENHLYDFSICKETTDTRDESFFQL